MRISDWSSDVCSSDLAGVDAGFVGAGDLVIRSTGDIQLGGTATGFRQQFTGADHGGSGGSVGGAGGSLRDRKRVVSGKSVSVSVDLGGRRIIKKTNNHIVRAIIGSQRTTSIHY